MTLKRFSRLFYAGLIIIISGIVVWQPQAAINNSQLFSDYPELVLVDDTIFTHNGDTILADLSDFGEVIFTDIKGRELDFTDENSKYSREELLDLYSNQDETNTAPQKVAQTGNDTTKLRYPIENEYNYIPSDDKKSSLTMSDISNISTEIEYDTETDEYIFSKKAGNVNLESNSALSLEEYREYDYEKSMRKYWKLQHKNSTSSGSHGLIPSIPIEGLDKIFGSNTIDIKPQGNAELLFGINISKQENPNLPEDLQRNVTFEFDEKISMSVAGQIGDKMSLGISYDTEATFDFENTTKLEYNGKEDEIIQNISAGNVSLPLNGTLITGSTSLFGFKTQLKFGKLTVTSIFSQQKVESSVIELKGGAKETDFKVEASDYEANKHFFLSTSFRDKYNDALANLPLVRSSVNITKIEVWVINKVNNVNDARNIVAFIDLAEVDGNIYNTSDIQPQGDSRYPTNNANTLYSELSNDADFRSFTGVAEVISSKFPNMQIGIDYEKIANARKLSETEFSFNPRLGFISLNYSLNSDEVLAVAYEYTADGKNYQVGELSNGGVETSQAMMLKLLKGSNISPKLPTWDLMMKNVYSIGAYQLNSDDFYLQVMYKNDKTGAPINFIPEGPKPEEGGVNGIPMIRVLNLDNADSQGDPNPDGYFDFIDGVTVKSSNGRIYFPVIEPFGADLKKKIVAPDPNNVQYQRIADYYTFPELYDSTQTKAKQMAEKNKFYLSGTYKSTGGNEIPLNAMNIPQGSVKVTAGGSPLTEGTDYLVDYTLGRVTILNESLLASGTPIKISLESQSMFNIGTKTLVGTHLDYKISNDFLIGGTILNLTEKPLTNKVSFGDEPISNTIWGLDGSYTTELPALTKMVDWLPLLETKEVSSISVNAEFAQLVPGSPRAIGKKGTSYIDDFEGSKTTIDLKSPYSWSLASTPQGQPLLFPEAETNVNDLATGYNRAKIAWYSVMTDLVRNMETTPSHLTDDDKSNHFVREVYEQEIFTNKEPVNNFPATIPILNLAFYPAERGSYNFDTSPNQYSAGLTANGLLAQPETRWGGIMRSLQTNDFEATNIEFIEFWLMDPFVYDEEGAMDNSPGASLYFNLGSITEDVLRDSRKSYENGLPGADGIANIDQTSWAVVPTVYSVQESFIPEDQDLQDVGLDGMNSDAEREFFNSYASYVQTNVTSAAARDNILNDPSADNYHYFKGGDYDAQQLSILERYKNYNGTEGNSPTDAANPESYPTSGKQQPDDEDINDDNTLNESESYFQYKVALHPNNMQIGQNYITDIVTDTRERKNGDVTTVKWYQFKIPINEPEAVVGPIQDFRSIRFMRMFLKGFDREIFLRFAKLDLVRGEWRKYTDNLTEAGESTISPQTQEGVMDVSAVNIEENASRRPVNYVLPPGVDRIIDPTNPQHRQLNEQSIVLKVLELADGDAKAAYKNLSLDVRQYKKLQMWIHAEAINEEDLEDGELVAFIRLGSDYKQNYYEYEIPLKLTRHIQGDDYYSNDRESDRYLVWPVENRLDIEFDVLHEVKQARNNAMRVPGSDVRLTSVYMIPHGDNTVKVVGNPTLSDIRTIMIGVRNPSRNRNPEDDGQPKSGEIWMNELRLTDFRDEGGWAANARVATRFADFATVTVQGNKSTVGFGSIEKKVNERQKEDMFDYSVFSNFELGKFFPKKYGVNIPMYVEYSESKSTPQYNPLDPDIPLSVTMNNNEISDAEKDHLKHISETYSRRKSINFTNVKIDKSAGSSSVVQPKVYSISNWSASYSFAEEYSRDVNTEFNRSKVYNGSLNYIFTNSPKNVTPFTSLKLFRSPSLKLIRDFNFYYAPRQLTFSTTMNKQYRETKLRNISDPTIDIEANYKKNFIWQRDYGVKWDITKALKVEYTAKNTARIDEPYGKLDKNDDFYQEKRDTIWNNIMDFGRTTNYMHNVSATYNVPINKIPIFSWISLSARYTSSFNWDAGPIIKDIDLGNTIKNSQNIQLTNTYSFTNLYNKVPFLKDINSGTATNKSATPKIETVTYEKADVELLANTPKVITHRLGTEDVEISAISSNGKTIEGKLEVVNGNKVKFTSSQDFTEVKITITGKKEVKVPVLGEIARHTLRFMMGLQNISITYTENNGTILPGYSKKTQILGMQDFVAPGVEFIMGIQDPDFIRTAMKEGWLMNDTSFYDSYQNNISQSITIRASIEPFAGFKIDVNATRQYQENNTRYYHYDGILFDDNELFTIEDQQTSGSFSISHVSIKTAFWEVSKKNSKAYNNFLEHRKEIAFRLAGENTAIVDSTGFPVGYSQNSQDVLLPAFIAAYSGNSASSQSFKKFPNLPLPNWKVTYDGLTKIEFVKKYMKNVTLTHAYSSIYAINSFVSNNEVGSFNDAGDFISEYQIGAASITERFMPLFDIDMTWNNQITTSFEINRTRNLTLNMSSKNILVVTKKEYVLGLGYTIPELALRTKKKTYNSDLNIRVDFSISDDITVSRRIEDAVNEVTTGFKRLTLQTSADYMLGDNFQLKLFCDYELTDPKTSSTFLTSNTKIGATVRINLF